MVRREVIRMGGGGALALLAGSAVARTGKHDDAPNDGTARRRVVDIGQGRISYIEAGRGPAALFLHGWPLHAYHWRDSMVALAADRWCLAPDLMGLGFSDVPDGTDLSPGAQAEMVIAFMDALDVAAADLVANDSGTAIAQILAVAYPHRVRSMLLTNGDVHSNSPSEALKPAIELAREGQLDELFERHLLEPGFAASEAGLGAICYTDPGHFTPELQRTYFAPLLESPIRRRQCQQYGVAFEPNPLPALQAGLAGLEIPVRMLWGTGDILFHEKWAYWLDATIPTSTGVRLVAGAKLFFTEEFPELVIEEARRLWQV